MSLKSASAGTVVVISPEMCHGSVGAVAFRHAIELSRRYKVFVITREAPAEVHENLGVILVRHHHWFWLHRYFHVPEELSFNWAVRQALIPLCRNNRVDIVWCHGHSTTALVAVPLRAKYGFRVVMTTHGDIFDRPPGTYAPELTLYFRAVTPRAYREADIVHALSPYMARWAIRGGARPERVRIIPNGIDFDTQDSIARKPRPASSFLADGSLRLLFVGSLWTVKGIEVLLRAVASLKAAYAASFPQLPNSHPTSLRLTLAGEGPLRRELEQLALNLGIAAQTCFLGQVARCDLPNLYRQADIVCVPSISEAFSMVTLEAMAFGVPVVGSDTGGIPSMVEDGVNGYVVAPGDAEALAAAISAAATSPDRLAELGELGFQMARKFFPWSNIALQLDELVRDAIEVPVGCKDTV